MKKLFGRAGGGASSSSRKDGAGPLTNKTVQVGPHTVLVEHVLGLGGYGEIYRAVDITTSQRFALKHLRLDQENIAEVQREAKTMARLRGHPNVLRLHAVAFAGPKGAETDGFFLLDYCPGTLLDLMSRHSYVLEGHTILHIFASVCHAVAAMHHATPPLAHRDIKAENVLMLPDGTWVVCDYGSATTRAGLYETPAAMAAEEEVISKHTTPAYRPPEMWDLQLMRQPIDTKVDIWALGVLLYVLCYGRLPFTGDSKLQIINGRYDLPPHTSTSHGAAAPATPPVSRPHQLVALIQALLQVDPGRRPNIDQLLTQLDAAAHAIMGQGILTPAAAAAGGGAPAAAPTASVAGREPASPSLQQQQQAAAAAAPAQHQQQQQAAAAAAAAAQQQQQQQQQQFLLQRLAAAKQAEAAKAQQAAAAAVAQPRSPPSPAAAAPGGGGGSFWGGTTVQSAYGAISEDSTAGATTPKQQSDADAPDWARFTSPPPSFSGSMPGAAAGGQETHTQPAEQPADLKHSGSGKQAARGAAANAATAAAERSSSSSSKRAPPPPPPAAANGDVPTPSTASQGVRAHAVAIASPVSSPLKGDDGSEAGNPFGKGTREQQQQQQPDLTQLQDIRARAAALAATKGAGSGHAQPAAAGERDAVGSRVAERQSRPYSNSSSDRSAGGGGPSGGSSSRTAGVPPQPATTERRVSDAAGAAVLSETIALRAQVTRLAEENGAFVVRLKQLEDHAVHQDAVVARLQQQVERLTQQQQPGPDRTLRK